MNEIAIARSLGPLIRKSALTRLQALAQDGALARHCCGAVV